MNKLAAFASGLLLLLAFRFMEECRAADRPNIVWRRYWALIACSSFGGQAASLAGQARWLLADDEPLVRVRAAEFLAIIGAGDPRPTLYEVLRTSESPVVTLLALNSVVFLRDFPPGYDFNITADGVRAKQDGVERRLEYLGR